MIPFVVTVVVVDVVVVDVVVDASTFFFKIMGIVIEMINMITIATIQASIRRIKFRLCIRAHLE
jgi:hypothetical protein